MNDTDITPALTAEEWGSHEVVRDSATFIRWPGDGFGVSQGPDMEPPDRHAAAALALHGQPFGFTHEDEDRLTYWVDFLEPNCTPEEHAALRSVVAKVRALLPPRE